MPEKASSTVERLKRSVAEQAREGLVKIGFSVDSDDWQDVTTEWLWAQPVADRQPPQAVLLNYPLHAEGVSHSDTVKLRRAENDPPHFFRFAGIAARGGHSTIIVLTSPSSDAFTARWPQLVALGCHYEQGEGETRFGPMRIRSLDIPPETDIVAVIAVLRQGATERAWMFRALNIEHELPASLGGSKR